MSAKSPENPFDNIWKFPIFRVQLPANFFQVILNEPKDLASAQWHGPPVSDHSPLLLQGEQKGGVAVKRGVLSGVPT